MFRTAPAVEPVPVEVEPADLIPLSHFALDHPQPVEGWSNFLGKRGISLRPDDIGRDSIRRSDAQILLNEQRANELRLVKVRQLAEQEAVEADQLRRAQIWKGAPATESANMSAGDAMAMAAAAAAASAQPRRTSPLEEVLSNSPTMTYHAWPTEEESA